MRNLLAVLMFLLSTSFALAQTSSAVDLSKLTDEQKQAVNALVDQFSEKGTSASEIIDAINSVGLNQEQISTWAQAGTEAGKAVTNFTSEVAVPAKDFMDSFIGRAIFLIAFMNYGGGKLASFFLDIGIFVVLTPVLLLFLRGIFRRFVLHMRMDENKRWWPVRSEEKGQEEVKLDANTSLGPVNSLEAVAGYIFIMVTTAIYLMNMWPTWPS